jgi:hypothetical protein
MDRSGSPEAKGFPARLDELRLTIMRGVEIFRTLRARLGDGPPTAPAELARMLHAATVMPALVPGLIGELEKDYAERAVLGGAAEDRAFQDALARTVFVFGLFMRDEFVPDIARVAAGALGDGEEAPCSPM